MPKPGIIMHNRPTKAGLYYVIVKLPFKVSIADFQSMYESKVQLPNNEQVEAGLLVWNDAGNERALSYNAAKAHIEKGAQIPSVRWVNKIAMIGQNGVVDAYAYYMHMKSNAPTLPGLSGAAETRFDKDGLFLEELDDRGRKFTASNAASLGSVDLFDFGVSAQSVAIGIGALAGGALIWGLFSAGILSVGWLIAIGLLLATAAPVAIHFVQVSDDPKKSKGLLDGAKKLWDDTKKTFETAAKWTAGILGLIVINNVLELIN